MKKPGLMISGAGNQIRTGDPNLGKVVLYQLSYSRNIFSPPSLAQVFNTYSPQAVFFKIACEAAYYGEIEGSVKRYVNA